MPTEALDFFDGPVTLRAYDPRWPELSARRRDTSAGALSAGVLRLEHVDPRLGDVLLAVPRPRR